MFRNLPKRLCGYIKLQKLHSFWWYKTVRVVLYLLYQVYNWETPYLLKLLISTVKPTGLLAWQSYRTQHMIKQAV